MVFFPSNKKLIASIIIFSFTPNLTFHNYICLKKKKTKNENKKGKKESKTIFLTEKEWNIIKYKFCLSYIKLSLVKTQF